MPRLPKLLFIILFIITISLLIFIFNNKLAIDKNNTQIIRNDVTNADTKVKNQNTDIQTRLTEPRNPAESANPQKSIPTNIIDIGPVDSHVKGNLRVIQQTNHHHPKPHKMTAKIKLDNMEYAIPENMFAIEKSQYDLISDNNDNYAIVAKTPSYLFINDNNDSKVKPPNAKLVLYNISSQKYAVITGQLTVKFTTFPDHGNFQNTAEDFALTYGKDSLKCIQVFPTTRIAIFQLPAEWSLPTIMSLIAQIKKDSAIVRVNLDIIESVKVTK